MTETLDGVGAQRFGTFEVTCIDDGSTDGDPLRGAYNRTLVPALDQLDALLRKTFVVNGRGLVLRTDVTRRAGAMTKA